MHSYELLKVQSRVVTSETGGGSKDGCLPSTQDTDGGFHQVVCVCEREKGKRRVSAPFRSQNGLQSDSAVWRLSCLSEDQAIFIHPL